MLIIRLMTVSLVVSILVAGIVLRNEQIRVFNMARDKAQMRTGMLRMLIMEHLDSPGLGDHGAVQKMLSSMAYGANLDAGHYVYARILDPQFREAASIIDRDYERIDEIIQYAGSRNLEYFSAVRQPEIAWINVGPKRYVHAIVPFTNSHNVTAAYMEGYFASTPQEERAALWNLIRAVLIATGTVIATSLLLYPFIVQLMRRIERLSLNLLDSNMEMLRVIGSAIAKRDSDTDIHNFRVTIYSVKIAETLDLDEQMIRTLIKGAFLHDVGKIGIRDNILLKPGRLDENEFDEMKKHVQHGMEIVNRSSWLKESLSVVGSHHEKYEGNGYPEGLAGKSIPLLARIFAVADVFDALTSHRPYKQPLSFNETIDILIKGRGIHFDPEILEVFIQIARPLYDTYGNRNDDTPLQDLDKIVQHYFKADIATFLD